MLGTSRPRMAVVNHSHASMFCCICASSNESPVKHAEYYTQWNIIDYQAIKSSSNSKYGNSPL